MTAAKKILCLMIAAVFVLSLASCGGGGTDGPDDPEL